MPIAISWRDLRVTKRLNDGDVISTKTKKKSDPTTTTFILELAPHLDWWKAIEVKDNTDRRIGIIEVDNNSRTVEIIVPSIDIEVGGKLVFWKAKLFGVHTAMYELAGAGERTGRKVTFRWSAD